METRLPRVLISHATADKPLIVQLGLIQGLLKTKAVELWCDTASEFNELIGERKEQLKDIKLMSFWRHELSRMVDHVDVVLACWSKAYVEKAFPLGDPAGGVWVRDELRPAQREGRVIHVALEKDLEIPALFRADMADEQISRLWNFSAGSPGSETECAKIADAAQTAAAARLRDFDAELDFISLFLDRDRQETPFVRNVGALEASGLVLVRGQREDDPDALRERFARVTWPVLPLLKGRAYDEVRELAFAGRLDADVTPCLTRPVRDGFRQPDVEKELDYIGGELGKFAPGVAAPPGERALPNALRALQQKAKADRVVFLGHMMVKDETWRMRKRHVCEVVVRLGRALAASPSPWLTLLVVLETPDAEEEATSFAEATKSLWRRMSGAPAPFQARDERYPADPARPALWSRLETLNPIEADHGADWGLLIARRLATTVDVAGRVRGAFGDQVLPMSKARPILSEAVRDIWSAQRRQKGIK